MRFEGLHRRSMMPSKAPCTYQRASLRFAYAFTVPTSRGATQPSLSAIATTEEQNARLPTGLPDGTFALNQGL